MSGDCGAWESERQGSGKRDRGVNGMVRKDSQLDERCGRRVGKLEMDEYKANLKRNECGAVETV